MILARQRALRRLAHLEQAEPFLQPQHARNRVVEPVHRDRAVAHLCQRAVVEHAPAVGRHEHVDPRIDRPGATGVAAPGDLAVRIPVGDHHAVEIHPALEHVGHQPAMRGQLDPVPAREAGHDRGDAVLDRRDIGCAVDQPQLEFGDRRIALVPAIGGPAVSEIVLRARGDVRAGEDRAGRWRPLEAADHAADIGGDQRRIGGIAFVGPSPAIILRDGHSGREGPFLPGDPDLDRGDLSDTFDQFGIARRAQSDIVRKDRGADDIAVAVHRIGAPHDRDRGLAHRDIHRGVVERVGQFEPFLRRSQIVAARPRIAPVEDRAEAVTAHILGRDAGDVRLDDLTHLLFDRHAREDRLDARLARFGEHAREGDLGPLFGMNARFDGHIARRIGSRDRIGLRRLSKRRLRGHDQGDRRGGQN